jgi:diguanylate cyclase (GGDEF)-like protein
MIKPNTPVNERKRLEKLRSLDVLDTLAEERFDRLVRIAKRMFAVPIALVSLVDENRQWFKSCVGLNTKESSREISFCGHAILDDEVFIVPNATKDPRFSDNPLVVNEPNIRFYAGCPLTVGGYKLGTLCILDSEPRNFEQDDTEALKDLASMVELELSAVQLSRHDELTGILNRRGFLALAQNNLHLSLRNKSPVTLVYLDLDHFKYINDNFGHAEGDAVLIAFSNLTKTIFRDSDIFARLGGDEFVLLLNGAARNEAEKTIDKLKQLLHSYNREAKRAYDVQFSFGIVEFNPQKHATINELLCEGDGFMYELKNSKR